MVNILVKSPAFEAGVRPGDLITGLDGEAVKSSQDLVSKLAALKPGSQVELSGQHGRELYKVKLAVIERPTRQAQQHSRLRRPYRAQLSRARCGPCQAGVRRIRAPSCCSFSSIAS